MNSIGNGSENIEDQSLVGFLGISPVSVGLPIGCFTQFEILNWYFQIEDWIQRKIVVY